MTEGIQTDYAVVHPVPGLGKPLDYVPTENDPLYVGKPLPSALLEDSITSEMFATDASVRKVFLPLLTVRELHMLQFMNEVTDKDEWQKKVFDLDIIKKWRVEVEPLKFTDSMFEHCIAELQYNAKNVYQDPRTPIAVYNGDVVKSDTALLESVKLELQEAVKVLEQVPTKEKDWHPGSDEMVLDLVHPSLFPLVYGKSRVLKPGDSVVGVEDCVAWCGQGVVLEITKVEKPKKKERRGEKFEPYSLKYQWLPCEVDISGEKPRIVSYINNLHPRHVALYSVIEQVVAASIPLWERTLAPLYQNPIIYHQRVPCTNVRYEGDDEENQEGEGGEDGSDDGEGVDEEGSAEDSGDDKDGEGSEAETGSGVEDAGEGEGGVVDDDSGEEDQDDDDGKSSDNGSASNSSGGSDNGDGSGDDEGNDGGDNDDGEEEDEDEEPIRVVIPPEPVPFDPEKLSLPKPVNFKELYGKLGRPLQVIVKLANIELTPEKPKYAGGTWHVEGKQNEHICATALYYYSCSNIKSSHLAFRQFVDQETVNEFDYEQNQWGFLEELFGCKNEEGASQDVGKVETREGRLLTFPNILQHQVQPFELEDATKPGHRKILALFLVDPNVRIISTAYVPSQRLDWWREAATPSSSSSSDVHAKGFDKLPLELKDQVFDGVDGFPITLLEAKAIRDKLMSERKKFVKQHGKFLLEMNQFSLCEH